MNRIRGTPKRSLHCSPISWARFGEKSGNAQGCAQPELKFSEIPQEAKALVCLVVQMQQKELLPLSPERDRLSRGSPLRAGHSPCRVRKSRPESMPVGAAAEGTRRDSREQQPSDLGSQAQAGAGTRLDCGGRRPWGWVHGPAPPPEPANRRFSPPLEGTGKGRKEGAGKPGQAWPGL